MMANVEVFVDWQGRCRRIGLGPIYTIFAAPA